MSRPYPIVEYARKIGKNTADLTVKDMINFTKEWVRQEIREDLAKMTPAQREVYNKDVEGMKQWRKEGNKEMAKHTTVSFQQAQTSRLAERGIESPINNGEEEIMIYTDEVVAEMGLTQVDVDALKWVITMACADYELGAMEIPLKELLEALEGV